MSTIGDEWVEAADADEVDAGGGVVGDHLEGQPTVASISTGSPAERSRATVSPSVATSMLSHMMKRAPAS